MRQAQFPAVLLTAASLLLAGCNRSAPEPSNQAPRRRRRPRPRRRSRPAPGAVRLYVSDETGGNVIVVDPEDGPGRRANRGRKTAARHPAVARWQAAARGAVGFADRRTGRRRIQAAAARPRGRRHRRGRPRDAQARAHATTAVRIRSRSTSRSMARRSTCRTKTPRRCRCSTSRTGDCHRASHGRRGAGSGDAAAGRQDRLRRLRRRQRSGGCRYDGAKGRGADQDRRAAARHCVHSGQHDGVRRQRERRQHHGRRCGDAQGRRHHQDSADARKRRPLPRPMGAAISPDGTQLYFSLGRAKSIAVIDTEARKFVRIHRGRRRSSVGHRAQRRRQEALHRERSARATSRSSTSKPARWRSASPTGGSPGAWSPRSPLANHQESGPVMSLLLAIVLCRAIRSRPPLSQASSVTAPDR